VNWEIDSVVGFLCQAHLKARLLAELFEIVPEIHLMAELLVGLGLRKRTAVQLPG
jgi:hypothetical protein